MDFTAGQPVFSGWAMDFTAWQPVFSAGRDDLPAQPTYLGSGAFGSQPPGFSAGLSG